MAKRYNILYNKISKEFLIIPTKNKSYSITWSYQIRRWTENYDKLP